MRYVVLLLVFLFSIFFTTEMQAQNESKSLTEYKIEQLQKELDKLKKDADDTKDNKLEQKKDIENINNRVGDINLYVAFYGTLTTVLLVGFGFISYKNAKTDAENTVEKWVENDGKKMLEAINKNLEKEAENKINSIVKAGEEKITALSNNFEKDHNEQLQKHENDHIELTKKYTPEEKEAVSQEAAKSQRKENKTFMDYWNFIVDFSANGKYDEILSTIMEVEASSIKMSIKQKADFQFAKGYVCSEKEMYDEAIEAYKKAIEINPKNDEAYKNMGNVYIKKGIDQKTKDRN